MMTLTELKDKCLETFTDIECVIANNALHIYSNLNTSRPLASFSIPDEDNIYVDLPNTNDLAASAWANPNLAFQFVSLFYQSQAAFEEKVAQRKSEAAGRTAKVAGCLAIKGK